MIENLDERLLEVLGHPMSPQARDPIVGLRTDIAEAELDDDRRARFPKTRCGAWCQVSRSPRSGALTAIGSMAMWGSGRSENGPTSARM